MFIHSGIYIYTYCNKNIVMGINNKFLYNKILFPNRIAFLKALIEDNIFIPFIRLSSNNIILVIMVVLFYLLIL